METTLLANNSQCCVCLHEAKKFDLFQTSHNNSQQPGVQMDAICNIQQCCICLHIA